ncbi:hypothetical protein TanjilG_03105 [Lupinus angustifolius]|uniref:Uncharacterized protein n=1 Tax=Lupinus angustifolius TaxID=3871 RepID=A0A4P1RCY2_LUPAN|nr:PREDICTED: uncharacterized protein LOC109351775 [Lupinus angustifolius]OIW08429.1 hypothetical protein TanjilG_03105 [Lupinus angustifolius]
MGNCMRNNKISAQDHENHETTVESCEKAIVDKIKGSSLSKIEAPRVQKEQELKKKKKVRFNIENDDEGDGNSRRGVMRIKVVMTQQELKRMLNCKKDEQHIPLEQLLSAVKLRGGIISEVCEN